MTRSNSPAKFVMPKRTCSFSWYSLSRWTAFDHSPVTGAGSFTVKEYIPGGSVVSSPIATANARSESRRISHLIGVFPAGVTSTILPSIAALEKGITSARVFGRSQADIFPFRPS